MKDLNRLLDEPGTDPLEANLLRLARGEGPSSESRRRILAGLGMTAAAGTLAVSSTAASSVAQGSGAGASSAALKWGVAGVMAVGVSVAAFVGLRSDPPPANLPKRAPVSSPFAAPPPAPAAAPATGAASQDSIANVPVTKLEDLPTLAGDATSDGAKSAAPAPSLADEVAAIKQAKVALASGDAAQALRELDNYRARFPRGRLAQEASVVRIESLLKAGNEAAANSAADRFLSANGDSPYAARVRSLVGR